MQKTVRNLLLIAVTLFVCNVGKVDALETSAHCVYKVSLETMTQSVVVDVYPDGSIKVDPGLSYKIAGITLVAENFITDYYFNYHNFVTDDGDMVCPNSIYIQSEDVLYTSQAQTPSYQLDDEEMPETNPKTLYTKLSYYVDKNDINKNKGFAEGILSVDESETFTSENGTLPRYANMCRYNDILLFYGGIDGLELKSINKAISAGANWNSIDWNMYKAFKDSDLPETCPEAIYVSKNEANRSMEVYLNSQFYLTKIELSSSHISSASELGFNGDVILDRDDKDIDYENCTLLGAKEGPIRKTIQWVIQLVYIIVPVLIIILTIVDFSSIVLSGEEKNFKSAGTKFVKRLIIGVAIIFLPMLLTFIIDMSGVLGPVTKNQLFCSLFE